MVDSLFLSWRLPGFGNFLYLIAAWEKMQCFLAGLKEFRKNTVRINKDSEITKKYVCNLYNIPSCKKRKAVLLYSQKG